MHVFLTQLTRPLATSSFFDRRSDPPVGLEEAGVVALLYDDKGDGRAVAHLQRRARLLDRSDLVVVANHTGLVFDCTAA